MDHIRRLVAVFFIAFVASAFALEPGDIQNGSGGPTIYTNSTGGKWVRVGDLQWKGSQGQLFSSLAAACSSFAAGYSDISAALAGTYGFPNAPSGDCRLTGAINGDRQIPPACPNGWSPPGETSQNFPMGCYRPATPEDENNCPSGQIKKDGVCVPMCKAGDKAGPGFSSGGQPVIGTFCSNGCVVDTVQNVGASGRVTWNLIKSGSVCSSEPPLPPKDPDPDDNACPSGSLTCPPKDGTCPKGYSAQEIGGEAVCVKNPDPPSSPSSGASSPGTGGPGQTSGNTSGSSSSTTTTHTTQNPDGSTTTTTTTTSTGEESKPNDIASFCSENASAAICQDKGSWAGSCASGFTCGGDAIQCAQARASWLSYCEVHTDATNAKVQDGISSMNGQAQPSGHPGANVSQFSIPNFLDTANPMGSSCPSDFQIPVFGASITVPLSGACGILRVMGAIAVAFTLVSAARIIQGAI